MALSMLDAILDFDHQSMFQHFDQKANFIIIRYVRHTKYCLRAERVIILVHKNRLKLPSAVIRSVIRLLRPRLRTRTRTSSKAKTSTRRFIISRNLFFSFFLSCGQQQQQQQPSTSGDSANRTHTLSRRRGQRRRRQEAAGPQRRRLAQRALKHNAATA